MAVSPSAPSPSADARALVECFGATADPAAYVPRRATERALAALVASFERSAEPAVLSAAQGMGKTLLLQLLARRLAERARPVYLPYPKLPQSELCALTLGLLGQRSGEYPEEDLLGLAFAQRAAAMPLALLIDDAGAMPLDAARGLAGLAAVTHGGLRLVFAVDDGPGAWSLIEAVGPGVAAVRLHPAMSEAETDEYLRRRVARALGARAAHAFDAEVVARIHAASGGVPRDVHLAAPALIGRGPAG